MIETIEVSYGVEIFLQIMKFPHDSFYTVENLISFIFYLSLNQRLFVNLFTNFNVYKGIILKFNQI